MTPQRILMISLLQHPRKRFLNPFGAHLKVCLASASNNKCTLILPNGTYTDVSRVKFESKYPYFRYTVYLWFDRTHRAALLMHEDGPSVLYLLSEVEGPASVKEGFHSGGILYKCYPNPVVQTTTVRFSLTKTECGRSNSLMLSAEISNTDRWGIKPGRTFSSLRCKGFTWRDFFLLVECR